MSILRVATFDLYWGKIRNEREREDGLNNVKLYILAAGNFRCLIDFAVYIRIFSTHNRMSKYKGT